MDITTAPATAYPREAWTSELRHRLPMETWVAGCTVLLWIGLALASPYFLTTGNVFNIMRQVSTDAIIAYGELFAIILAGIDLSVGAVAGLTGVVFAMMLSAHVAMPLAIIGSLAVLVGLRLAMGVIVLAGIFVAAGPMFFPLESSSSSSSSQPANEKAVTT